MGFAILRTEKLKDRGSIRRSLKHAFREQITPNADPELTPENTHIGAKSSDEAIAKINDRLPEKIRKNGVLAIEYLITASPEDMTEKTRTEQDQYFIDSLKWLKKRHGNINVVYAGIHRDEKTPHMYAYVVPIDERGKLNCRAFLGGSKALNKMQTDFAERVGKEHGLKRGIEGSRAKHQRVKQFYGMLNTPEKDIKAPERRKILKKGILKNEYETDYQFSRRVTNSVLEQMQPTQEKARITDSEQRRSQELQKTNDRLREKIKAIQRPFLGLTKDQIIKVVDIANSYQIENQEKKLELEKQRKLQRSRSKDIGFSR